MADVPFFGRVTDGVLHLAFKADYDRYIRRFEGDGVEVIVRKQKTKRTDRQNNAMWALLTEWATAMNYEINDLKDDVMGETFGWNDRPSPLSHRILPRRPRSSKLTVEEFCQVIESILQLAATNDGLCLMAPDEYRHAREELQRQHVEEDGPRSEPGPVSGPGAP